MTGFVKHLGVWSGVTITNKESDDFKTVDVSTRYNQEWNSVSSPENKIVLRVSHPTSNSTLKISSLNAIAVRGLDPNLNVSLNLATSSIVVPVGTHDIEVVVRGNETVNFDSNIYITHILSLADYKGSTFPTLRSSVLTSVPTSIPETITSLASAFIGCDNFNGPVVFDTSNVTNMSDMFGGCRAFNQPIDFNTSNVTTMSNMFNGCSVFNSPVTLDTGNVTNMVQMFYNCRAFNQPIDFNTSKVTSMVQMFYGCSIFNSPLLFSDTSKVTDFSAMFYICYNFNMDLSGWDTSSATSWTNFYVGSSMPSSHVPAKFR